MSHHHRPLQEGLHAGLAPGLAYGLELLAGPLFHRRVLAPDAARGGSGHGGTPRGVPLPGLQAARQGLGLSQAELAARSGASREGDQPPRARWARPLCDIGAARASEAESAGNTSSRHHHQEAAALISVAPWGDAPPC